MICRMDLRFGFMAPFLSGIDLEVVGHLMPVIGFHMIRLTCRWCHKRFKKAVFQDESMKGSESEITTIEMPLILMFVCRKCF